MREKAMREVILAQLGALRADAGVELVACAVDGLVATVQVQAMYAGLPAVSRARAGPPGT